MVVGQRDHARPELDMTRPSGRRRYEYLRRCNRLPPGTVVLTYPGFVVAQGVELLNELEVAFESKRWILAQRVERSQEDAELHIVCTFPRRLLRRREVMRGY